MTEAGRRIGTRELRAALPEAIRRAAAGDRTVITARGRPIAQLAPLDETAPSLDHLVSSGAIVPPRRTTTFRPPAPIAVWAGVRVDQALRELRG